MRRGRYRIAVVFVGVVAAAIVLAGIVVEQALVASLRSAGVSPDAFGGVVRDVTVALATLGVILVGVALVAGRAMAGALRDLRAALLAHARGDTGPLPWFAVRELSDLSSAAERLFAHSSVREQQLAREGADTNALLAAISEGILQLDSAGRVVRANPSARALLRIGERTGQPLSTVVRNVEMRRILDAAAAGQTIDADEISIADRRLIVSARPIVAPENTDNGGAVVAFVDLTEVRRLEGVRRDFVANVSHELKTPLTSIRGYVETLLGDESLPPEVRTQFLLVVQKNADRLHRIVDDLLDLSRLESGGWRPEPQAVNANELIDDVWSSCSVRAADRRITWVPPATAVRVVADPGGLRQVFVNLLDNALRYTQEGGRIEVRACAEPEGDGSVIFEVRDNGQGIPSDALPRIFERFYRVDPARSRAEGGTGLGLSIVKHLVERMGGDISASSELGKGTTIRFRLPAAS